ncbi:MAG: NAD(P)/FAD-dependent oxidoreductase [Saccharofermentans sp.]|nr:NAD(P)/FAD-dependent oxidoreductase [Saccharofermentans sp.]
MKLSKTADLIIIGAGIVGCSIARELSRYSISVLVLEAGFDVGEGATKANSGIIHAGFDAIPGTKKALYNVKGAEMYPSLCKSLGVAYKQCGALVIALSEDDRRTIKALLNRGISNGVKGLEIIEKDEVLRLEPNINPDTVCALYAPTSAIVSPYEVAFALADDAACNGVEFLFNERVNNVSRNNEGYCITTDTTQYNCHSFINCSGTSGAKIHNMISDTKLFSINRRGQYYLLDKLKELPFSRTIFQCPSTMGKGVLVSPTIHGNTIIGPTAEDIADPDDKSTTKEGLADIVIKSRRIWPNAYFQNSITNFSGIRSHLESDDFIIGEIDNASGAFEVIGIESPGLTSAPAIAEDICNEIVNRFHLEHKKAIVQYKCPNRSFGEMSDIEREQAVISNKLNGNIICRCEMVTEAEIRAAINRPIKAKSIDAVKRRTRAGMGRCQGGFCTSRIMSIITEETGLSPVEITKSGGDSYLLMGDLTEFLRSTDNE